MMEQLPFLQLLPKVDWRTPRMSELPASWADAKRVCIDFETKDTDLDTLGPGTHRPGNYVCGIGFSIEDGPAFYLPMKHEGGDNVEEGEGAVWTYFRDRIAEYRGTLIAANAGYEIGWMLKHQIDISGIRWWRDPQVAEPLIWELHRSYRLDDILKRHGFEGKKETTLKNVAAQFSYHPKRDLYRLPARYVGEYALGDVNLHSLMRKLERRIEDEDLTEVYTLESKVTPICAKMRHRGIRVNLDKVDRVERWAKTREAEILRQIHDLTGRWVTPEETWNKGAVLALFNAVQIDVPMSQGEAPKLNPKTGRMSKGKDPTPILDKKFFGGCKHPLGDLVRRWREVNKTYTTFCKRVRKYAVRHGDEWRVHCSFHQLRATDDGERESKSGGRMGVGTRTGRLSSDHYNIQQELSRSTELVDPEDFPHLDHARVDKEGAPDPWNMAEVWKDIYEPDRGSIDWGDLDYSQQEPRIEVNFAEKAGLTGAKQAADRWRAEPRLDGHKLIDDLIFELTGVRLGRKTAKNTRLALGYGAGGGKLCDTFLFLPTMWKTFTDGPLAGKTIKVAGPEGQKVMDAFNKGAPFIRELAKMCERLATQRGWIRTLLGRVIHFEMTSWNGVPKAKDGHAASNGLCQGGAASQGKQALIDLDAAGHKVQIAVHDAFGLSLWHPDQVKECHDIMVGAVTLTVPVVVDYKVGASMGQAA